MKVHKNVLQQTEKMDFDRSVCQDIFGKLSKTFLSFLCFLLKAALFISRKYLFVTLKLWPIGKMASDWKKIGRIAFTFWQIIRIQAKSWSIYYFAFLELAKVQNDCLWQPSFLICVEVLKPSPILKITVEKATGMKLSNLQISKWFPIF